MFSSAHCSPAGHPVPPQAMMPHCPHVGGGPTHAHCPFVSSPHVWPFVQTGLPEQTVGPHSGSVVVVVVGGHTVQKPPLHPNPVKHVVPPQHGAPLKPQHGFGSHVPAPRLTPPAVEQSLAVSRTQAKAPMGDPGTQHWTDACVVVVGLVVVEVVVVTGQSGSPGCPVQVH